MQLEKIGTIETPFEEKFGTPRQPGLIREAGGVILLNPPWNGEEAVRGLGEFSHLWVVYGFHLVPEDAAQPTVRPPRLGGNERMGVFATRSPFRPNRLGLSVVEIQSVAPGRIEVSGVDIVSGSPVFDLKPYLPWVESLPEAQGGFADLRPEKNLEVSFCIEIADQQLLKLIEATVAHDPRPAYRSNEAGEFGMRIAGHNVRWRVFPEEGRAEVFELD
ncbi:MAG: tRNA-Thr(GGU) m(6)t(6)A37 methyltransferase TsaA [Verrucomicrobiales bacterium]|jgi:tRNA-Thr(GGU) m(6)t(6)A37 methyltransferase TsaA